MNLGQTLVMPHVVAYGLVLVAGVAMLVTGFGRLGGAMRRRVRVALA